MKIPKIWPFFGLYWFKNGQKWAKNIFRIDFEVAEQHEIKKNASQMKDEIKPIHFVYFFNNFVLFCPFKIYAENIFSPFLTIFGPI